MATETPTKVLLVGAGALGSVFAWRLQVGGTVDVTAVCRSNYDTVKKDGFRIISCAFGDHIYRPTRVVRTVDEAVQDGEVYDFVIFCTKALPNLGDNSHIVAPALKSPHTVIMLIQNGIDIEEPFAARYPNNPIVSVIAYIDTSQPSDGVIEHGNNTNLLMGLYSPETATYDVPSVVGSVKALNEVWEANGAVCKYIEKIQPYRWSKLVWNASFNTVAVVSGGYDTKQMLDNPYCKQLIKDIMIEVYRAGEAVTGEPLPKHRGMEGPDEVIEDTAQREFAVIPSMLMDFRAKRPMEHVVILKNPIEAARKRGVSTPYMEAVYALLVMVEKGYLN
ncbi:ApbA-domain-containing protein [Martensiomyces pterosporus]|nr:ApbA-domain-containing protein [Martensiomyces pterosporus]